MSLFGAMQVGATGLKAAQLGLHVTSNNIANVNTPGYAREELILTPAKPQQLGDLTIGMGVVPEAIIRVVDDYLFGRTIQATNDLAAAQVRDQAHAQLENILGELGDNGLSGALQRFVASINEAANQPENVSLRRLAALEGDYLAKQVNSVAKQLNSVRASYDQTVVTAVGEVNTLTAKIAQLNVEIANGEFSGGGGVAGSLRSARSDAVDKLSKLIEIEPVEQSNGSLSIYLNGVFLVHDGVAESLDARPGDGKSGAATQVFLEGVEQPITPVGGEIGGALAARDEVIGGFADRLDELVGALAYEFNRIHSSGQGRTGYEALAAGVVVHDATVPLDEAGLSKAPQHGSFEVLVYHRDSEAPETTRIDVPLLGLDDDLTLDGLAAALDAVDGLSATIDIDGRLQLGSDSDGTTFAFQNDSSGVLASLGLGTFFSGDSAINLGVRSEILKDPAKFALSRDGVDVDNLTGLELASFLQRPLESLSGQSFDEAYAGLVNETAQGAAVSRANLASLGDFEQMLRDQNLGVSGVSLDEEVMKLIQFQRMYQASARVLSTIDQLLEMLVNL